MLQYLFSAALKKLELFHTEAVGTLVSTCAFSTDTSGKHYPCDLGVGDGACCLLLRNPFESRGSRKHFHSFLFFLFFSAFSIPIAASHEILP